MSVCPYLETVLEHELEEHHLQVPALRLQMIESDDPSEKRRGLEWLQRNLPFQGRSATVDWLIDRILRTL